MATSFPFFEPVGVENTFDITSNTDVRDVSSVLDAVYVADTPFLNRVGWGGAVKNKVHEWITDSIGYGYLILSNAGTVASNASTMIFGSSGCGAVSTAIRQIHTGTVLKYNNQSTDLGYSVVEDFSLTGTVWFTPFSGTSTSATITDAATFFIVGNAVKEGSEPRKDSTRPRQICSNKTQIFREDVRMTGTRQAIEMYGVPNELRKQIGLRTKEYKRQVERSMILGFKETGVVAAGAAGATETQMMGGIYDFLRTQSGSHIDNTTTTLTETKINDVAQAVYDFGGEPNTLLLGPKQARVIPTLERARVRVEQDSKIAGFYVNKYMTDLGVEMSILISRWVPKKFAFVLDANKIKMMPLRGRKFNLEKIGKKGDYVEWELISEITMEFRGYTLGQHGMFTLLS
jgi:hypothetical protein